MTRKRLPIGIQTFRKTREGVTTLWPAWSNGLPPQPRLTCGAPS